MLIRIVKALPAPLMDGFDVSGFHTGQIYEVDTRVGRYPIVAQYAEPLDHNASDKAKPRGPR
jgi:hypothetical protein